MTPADLVGRLHIGREHQNILCFYTQYLAENVLDSELVAGGRLCDATDFKAWLGELAKILRGLQHT